MKCQLCHKNEANLQVKQVIDGNVREVAVCRECAAKSGLKEASIPMLTDFLFGIGMKPQAQRVDEDKVCAECHMRYSDFQNGSLLGCPVCYESFALELEPLLSSMHEGKRHAGKAPAGERKAAEVQELRERLAGAVAAQDFETAAELRDRLKELESGIEAQKELNPSAGVENAG